jgi:glycosyltransferase involved in cell wall biosynthesis
MKQARRDDRESIYYFMHVPWDWIKQRPHYIAERLSTIYDVSVRYPRFYRTEMLTRNPIPPGVSVAPLFRLPYERVAAVSHANRLLLRAQFGKLRGHSIYWFTSPYASRSIAGALPANSLVVYDCMDDALGFPAVKADPRLMRTVEADERALASRADLVLASSRYLAGVLASRYGLADAKVVNNALNGAGFAASDAEKASLRARFPAFFGAGGAKICYIGTISKWFDFESVSSMLDAAPGVSVHLFGPADTDIPRRGRLLHHGPVEHSLVGEVMDASDALIMPFVLDELVLSVNPVKLYEYVGSGKPCIAVSYGETRAFEEYVYLYEDRGALAEYARSIASGSLRPKAGRDECARFAMRNTWEARMKDIAAELDSLRRRRMPIRMAKSR